MNAKRTSERLTVRPRARWLICGSRCWGINHRWWVTIVVVAVGSSPAQAAQLRVTEVGSHQVAVRVKSPAPSQAHINAEFEVECTPADAWSVLTAYDRYADFLPTIMESEIVSRTDDVVHHRARGRVHILFWKKRFETVIASRHTSQRRIDYHAVEGDFPQLDGWWEIVPLEGPHTLIRHEGHVQANFYMPGWVMRMVQRVHILRVLEALIIEMERVAHES